MRIKRFILLLLPILLIISFNYIAYAERKILKPPMLLSFNSEEYLDKEYTQSLVELKEIFKKHRDNESLNFVSALFKTTRKDSSIKSVRDLSNEIKKYEQKNKYLFNELNSKITKVKNKIEEGSFNKHQTGVDFEADEKNRVYIISWDEDGREVIKRTPFVPEMKLVIESGYIPQNRDRREIKVYQYFIKNKEESKASFLQLYIENKFSQAYILNKIKSKHGGMSVSYKIKDNLILNVSYPEGYLNYFRFFISNATTEMLIKYNPGQQMDHPFELEEIEGSLPGIIECSVPVSDTEFNPNSVISAEDDIEIAATIVSGVSLGPHRYRYWGKTIGPVPIPEPFEQTRFIEQIISYTNQSISEGWIDKKEVIEYAKNELNKIKKSSNNKNLIKSFLEKIEEYYKKDMILSEAYVLLKYNLEYLLPKM